VLLCTSLFYSSLCYLHGRICSTADCGAPRRIYSTADCVAHRHIYSTAVCAAFCGCVYPIKFAKLDCNKIPLETLVSTVFYSSLAASGLLWSIAAFDAFGRVWPTQQPVLCCPLMCLVCTAAYAATERFCYTTACAALDVSVLQQPVLLDVSILQQTVLPEHVFSTAPYAAPPWTNVFYSSLCCPWTCRF
jgi:hypothetical protein